MRPPRKTALKATASGILVFLLVFISTTILLDPYIWPSAVAGIFLGALAAVSSALSRF